MFRTIRNLACYAILTAVLFTVSTNAQDRVTVNQSIRFARGASSATVSRRIARGTSHVYLVRARAGQQMAVVLKTGNKTSFTVTSDSTGILEGADGVRRTVVELPESGEYEIQIGTDATANYTLEVTIN